MQMYGGQMLFVGRAGDCYSWENVENGCSIPRANFDNFGACPSIETSCCLLLADSQCGLC